MIPLYFYHYQNTPQTTGTSTSCFMITYSSLGFLSQFVS